MNTATLVIAVCLLGGAGAAGLVSAMLPAHPDLRPSLRRLDGHTPAGAVEDLAPTDAVERAGAWLRRATRSLPVQAPIRDLSILQIPLLRWYGEKVAFSAIGLVFAPVMTLAFSISGFVPPWPVPVIGSLLLGAAAWFIPDWNVRDDAAAARLEFTRALGAYIDLVALQRRGGLGPTAALQEASAAGKAWMFVRLQDTFRRAELNGVPAWDALCELGVELDMPALSDVGDSMRLSGAEGAAVYTALRERAAALRNALLEEDRARANVTSEVMYLPGALLFMIFVMVLVTPFVLRLIGNA